MMAGNLRTAPCAIKRRPGTSPLPALWNFRNRRLALSIGLLALSGGAIPAPRLHAAELVAVDVTPLATAYRVSKILGANVVNDTNDKIGTVDDLIVTPDHVLFTVVSVGGFLGLGRHLVVVPFASLVIDDANRKIVLPGATKDALKKLPEFQYGS
jgi:hypothetical protein